MIPAVIYGAKSTKDPHLSIPAQLQDAREAAEAAGCTVAAPYSDEAASAYTGNRGQGLTDAKDHALRLAAEHGSATLWVQHSDRLARGDGLTADHLAEVWFALRRHGVALRSAQDDHNLEDALRVVLVGERNHEDSARKAQAVARGHRSRRERGGYHGGPEPYGLAYPRDEGGRTQPWLPLVHSEHAPVVARMAQLILEGSSLKGAARILNAEGVPTGQKGRRWHGETVHRIITNPIYAGLAKDGSQLAHVPVIDADTYRSVLDLLGQRRRGGGGKGGRPTTAPALFINGHLRCGQCGHPMGYRRKPNRRSVWERYVCTEREQDVDSCSQQPVPVAAVEAAVLEEFRRRALGREGSLAAFQTSYQADLAHVVKLREGAERELAKAEAATARVRADYKAGDITAAEWRELRSELDEELTAARAQAELLAEREQLTRLRASDQVHDAFTEALITLGHSADQALRGELPLAGVRDGLRALFPICTWRQDGIGGHVDLGEPEAVALRLDDELPGKLGESLLDRDSTSATLGLTSAAVIAPIYVEVS